MHCKQNIVENLLSIVTGMKDGPVVRKDIEESSCKKSLHIYTARPPSTGYHILKALYILSKENKKKFIDKLRALKIPIGYMSNFKIKISEDESFHGLKNHDYHVLL